MLKIALFDCRYGHNNQHVRGAEFVVNHRAVADIGAKPQVAFDQRRKRPERRFRIDRLFRHPVHLDITFGQRPCTPWLRRTRIVMKKRQRKPGISAPQPSGTRLLEELVFHKLENSADRFFFVHRSGVDPEFWIYR